MSLHIQEAEFKIAKRSLLWILWVGADLRDLYVRCERQELLLLFFCYQRQDHTNETASTSNVACFQSAFFFVKIFRLVISCSSESGYIHSNCQFVKHHACLVWSKMPPYTSRSTIPWGLIVDHWASISTLADTSVDLP